MDVVADPATGENAELMRDEVRALPGPERAVELIEQLALTARAGSWPAAKPSRDRRA